MYQVTAKQLSKVESQALNYISDNLDSDFLASVNTVLKTTAKSIICRMGKSGIIGKKLP